MTESEKVEILLREYDILREEILQRSNQRFQFLAIAGAIGAFALFRTSPLSPGQTAAIIAATVIVLCVWFRLGQIIAMCSRRIAEIEGRVNALAGDTLLKGSGRTWHTVSSIDGFPQGASAKNVAVDSFGPRWASHPHCGRWAGDE